MRSLDAAGLTGGDLRVARVLEERREPADLELGAPIDEHVGFAQFHDEARPRVDEVGIFGRFREDGDVDILSADLARERSVIGKGGDDVHLRLRGEGGR